MPASTARGTPISLSEFDRLGEDPRAEYIDSALIMSPSPSYLHQQVCRRLANVLEAALPDQLRVVTAWSWRTGGDEFVPDVMVVPAPEPDDPGTRFTGNPSLVVEVLSSNRSTDLVVKVGKYARAAVPHYWVVDPREGLLDAFALEAGTYRLVGHVTPQDGPVSIDVGLGTSVITVELDVRALLRT